MMLLLDLGNTRLKWALADPGAPTWAARGAFGWTEPDSNLVAAWAELPRPSEIIGASVAGAPRETRVGELVERIFSQPPAWVRTPAAACGVRNVYAEPANLGIDRFLAMVAAHASGQAPCILVGVGTAVTLDALDRDGGHLGGLIAPGPHLMQQTLLQATAQIRVERPGQILELADNTADAVVSGCWQAVAGLIERLYDRVAPRWNGDALLLLDGGDASPLLPLLRHPARLSSDGVLRGLAVWAAARPLADASK